LRQIVLDAGPLIGLFYAKDIDHHQCVAGFSQLSQAGTVLLTPVPIIYEVYKWLLHNTTPITAQQTLKGMEASLMLIPIDSIEFRSMCQKIQSLFTWQGTLEDFTVITMALQYQCPVWTLNYRDFASFSTLNFWNPE
jgi:predicted nucleic acid-binding protein